MMERERSLDQRQRRTREAFQTALLALMSEKPIEKITVSELALRAEVNRKTFYNHYESVQDVRRKMDEAYLNLLFSFMDGQSGECVAMEPGAFLCRLTGQMKQQPVRTRLLFASGETASLAERFRGWFTPYFQSLALERNHSASSLPYVVDYVISGVTAMLKRWVDSDYELPEEALVQSMTAMVQSSYRAGLLVSEGAAEQENIQEEYDGTGCI